MKRPWNIVNMPVYSLATYRDGEVNMNVCTYVTSVSMKPKLFMVAVDYTTQTFENLQSETNPVLQILSEDHARLVPLLGKKSGKQVNKQQKLAAGNHLDTWNGHQVLKGACGYLELKKGGQENIGGDHELFWFEVTKSSTKSESGILMFQDLIEKRIIL